MTPDQIARVQDSFAQVAKAPDAAGQLFYSRDSGENWDLLADFLPPIQSVEAAVIED